MFPEVLIFVSGVAVGAGLIIANRKSCENAVSEYRKRNDAEMRRLRSDNEALHKKCFEFECMRRSSYSYRNGYEKGRHDPMTEAEQFAETFNGRKATFRNTSPTA